MQQGNSRPSQCAAGGSAGSSTHHHLCQCSLWPGGMAATVLHDANAGQPSAQRQAPVIRPSEGPYGSCQGAVWLHHKHAYTD